MKTSRYSPDAFMQGIYAHIVSKPYKNVCDAQTALQVGEKIKEQTKAVLGLDDIPDKITDFEIVNAGKPLG